MKKRNKAKQTGLRSPYRDTRVFHSQVRVGKRRASGKPKAIVITKVRTMEKGAYADFGKIERNADKYVTRLPLARIK